MLPFQSRSPDSADAYLADGMTEEIANQLTRVGRLQVKARGLVSAQWRRTPDPFEAARHLNVAWFVHGNVRHVSGQLLVNVELVRATSGEEAWATRFPRRDADVFAVQAEVAESVAVQVGGRLTPGERAEITRRPTRNNEAYRLYLYGSTIMGRRTPADLREAVSSFEQALRLDSSFASAWARLAMARGIQWSWGWEPQFGTGDSLLVLGRAAARRAVALDSASADAWLATAFVDYNRGLLWSAQRSVARSIGLDSMVAEAWHLTGLLFGADCPGGCLDDLAHAAPPFRRALALDPTLRNTWRQLAVVTRDAGRLAEAEGLLDTALSFGPWGPAYRDRGYVRLMRGNTAGALADLDAWRTADGDSGLPFRAVLRVLQGDSAPARARLAAVRADTSAGALYAVAAFSVALGRYDDALAALAERRRRGTSGRAAECAPGVACSANLDLWLFLQDPLTAPLRGDPRFQRLLEDVRPRVPWLDQR